MSAASPNESRLDRFFRRASARIPEGLRKREHGDKPNSHPPYALIQVQLFKNDLRQNGDSQDDQQFDTESYHRTVEGIEHVIRVNRHTFFSTLIDFSEPIALTAFFAFGWSVGLGSAFAIIDVIQHFQAVQ